MSTKAKVSRRTHSSAARRAASLLLAACLLPRANTAAAFSYLQCTAINRRHSPPTTAKTMTPHYSAPKRSSPGDEPWREDESYRDMLRAASKDPEAFERFVEERMARKKRGAAATTTNPTTTTDGNSAAEMANGEATAPKKKKKYVPIEEWDAQRRNGENMSREERLQWEAQRDGNRYRQNEILRHTLKSF